MDPCSPLAERPTPRGNAQNSTPQCTRSATSTPRSPCGSLSARLPGHQSRQGKAVPLGLFFWGFNVYMFAKQCCLCVHCVSVWSLQKRK